MKLRRTFAGLVAGVAALSLVGAAAPTSSVGTASTSLLGAEIEITNLGSLPVVRILDVGTFASTDTDAARNTLGNGVPFAQAAVIPLQVGEQAFGAVTASSDTGGSASGNLVSYGDALEALGVDVTPVTATANATAAGALASVNTLVAEVTALLGAIGVDIDVTGLTSQVTQSGASAIQGISVGEISLTLADLGLTEDLLGSLPLDDLLALLQGLPVPLPTDVDAAVDAVMATLADIQGALAAFEAVAGPIADAAGAVEAAAAELEMLTGLQTGLGGVTVLNFADFLAGLGEAELAVVDACVDTSGLIDLDLINTLIACVDAAVTAAEGVLDDAIAALEALVDALPVEVAALEDLVATLSGAIASLGDLIDTLLGLLDDVAGTELLSVGAFDVGITALAAKSVDTSAATVGCTGIDVTVLGETFSTPDCSEGLSAISDALAGLTDAITGVVDLLNTLPLAGLVEVGDLTLDVFGGLTESVTTDGTYVTSTAGLNLLELEIPSITIDPSAVTDLLGVDLPDVVGVVTAALEDVLAELEAVTGVAGGAVTTVTDTLDSIDGAGGLAELVTTLQGVLAGLDLGSIGSLAEAVSTPGLRILVDPVSTAQYAAGAPATPVTPPTDPAPTPTQGPMPATGGGLALIGLLTLAGASAIRRRN